MLAIVQAAGNESPWGLFPRPRKVGTMPSKGQDEEEKGKDASKWSWLRALCKNETFVVLVLRILLVLLEFSRIPHDHHLG